MNRDADSFFSVEGAVFERQSSNTQFYTKKVYFGFT